MFKIKIQFFRPVALLLASISISGCFSGSGGEVATNPTSTTTLSDGSTYSHSAPVIPAGAVADGLAAIGENAESSAFNLPAGVPPATLNSPLTINFRVLATDGRPVANLPRNLFGFTVAKLVRGSNGDSDQWQSYIYRTQRPLSFDSDGKVVVGTGDIRQASTENSGTLTYHADEGYYSYTFATDIEGPIPLLDNQTLWDPDAVHRLAFQLRIQHNGATIAAINPYIDVKFVEDNGTRVAQAVDPSESRIIVATETCNQCHNKLQMHGGGRVETQYCVTCHNPSSNNRIAGSGTIDFSYMVHKIHRGKGLPSGNGYQVSGYGNTAHDYSKVAFPQDPRNCSTCHSESAATPHGNNWQQKPTINACGSCHDNIDFTQPGTWRSDDNKMRGHSGNTSIATYSDNSKCVDCHAVPGSTSQSVAAAHYNQVEARSNQYALTLHRTDITANGDGSRNAAITFSLSNPQSDAKYDLVAGCSTATPVCYTTSGANKVAQAQFSGISLYAAYHDLTGDERFTDFTGYKSWGVCNSTSNGDGTYTLTLEGTRAIPAAATGSVRILSLGSVREARLQEALALVEQPSCVNVSLANQYQTVALDGGTPRERRTIVSDANCQKCHSTLGAASGGDENHAFHSGSRNSVEGCMMCHNPLRVSSSSQMSGEHDTFATDSDFAGLKFSVPRDFKSMVHAIHGQSKRDTLYMPNQEEVAFPGILHDCTTCHTDDAYRHNRAEIGTRVLHPTRSDLSDAQKLAMQTDGAVDPRKVPSFSPKAASCVGCHDSQRARDHMQNDGGARFGVALSELLPGGSVVESCNSCHNPGGIMDIQAVHKIK
jgi:OmcA/MtrC family decaheme c-type cytochrome